MQNFQVVDISAWQEKLNWQKLKANNIQGVIIKIGEYTHLDEMFISHVNNAVTYNLPYGIYYYAHASTIDKAIAEANWDKINKSKHISTDKIHHLASGMMQKINLYSKTISM